MSNEQSEAEESPHSSSTEEVPAASRGRLPYEIMEMIMIYADRIVLAQLSLANKDYRALAEKHRYETVTISPPIERAVAKLEHIRSDEQLREYVKRVRYVLVCDNGITEDIFETNAAATTDTEESFEFNISTRKVKEKWEDFKSRQFYGLDSDTARHLISTIRDLPPLQNIKEVEFIGPQDTNWGKDFPISYRIKHHAMEDFSLTFQALSDLTLGRNITERRANTMDILRLKEFETNKEVPTVWDLDRHTPIDVHLHMATKLCGNLKRLSLETKSCMEIADSLSSVLLNMENVDELEFLATGVGTTNLMIEYMRGLLVGKPVDRGMRKIKTFRIIGSMNQDAAIGVADVVYPFNEYDGVRIDHLQIVLKHMSKLELLRISNMALVERTTTDRFAEHAGFLDEMRKRQDVEKQFMDIPEFDRFGTLKQRQMLAQEVYSYVNPPKDSEASLEVNPLFDRGADLPEEFPDGPLGTQPIKVYEYCRRRFHRRDRNDPEDEKTDNKNDNIWRRNPKSRPPRL